MILNNSLISNSVWSGEFNIFMRKDYHKFYLKLSKITLIIYRINHKIEEKKIKNCFAKNNGNKFI